MTLQNTRSLSDAIRDWRMRYNLTQAHAALVLQVPLGTLQGWEVARYATPNMAKWIYAMVQHSPEEIDSWLNGPY